MAAKTKAQTDRPDFVDPATLDDEPNAELLSTAPDDWEFETIADESPMRVVFDTLGDVFIGRYVGKDHITPENEDPFDLFTFRGRDEKLYAVNTSYKLVEAMEKVQAGQWVRLTYVKDIPSKKGNPMKDFKVDVKK